MAYDHETISKFVKELDLQVADLDFTEGLRDYFIKECKKEYQNED